jgi:hypothetical protein
VSAFPELIVDDAFERQDGLCGYCGADLEETSYEAHHLNGEPTDDRLDNCVLLCALPDDDCHHFAHDYDWWRGALLKKKDFPYWDGDPDEAEEEQESFWGPALPD